MLKGEDVQILQPGNRSDSPYSILKNVFHSIDEKKIQLPDDLSPKFLALFSEGQ